MGLDWNQGYPCEPLIPNTHRYTENRSRLCAYVCGQRVHVYIVNTQDAPRKAWEQPQPTATILGPRLCFQVPFSTGRNG